MKNFFGNEEHARILTQLRELELFDLPLLTHLCGKLTYLGSILLEGQKSERIENGERMEMWEDRKDFIFSPFCLVGSGKVEGWKK